MKNIFKQAGMTFYFKAAALVLAFVAWIILLVSSGIAGYPMARGGLAIAFGIIAVLMIGGSMFMSKNLRIVADILVFAAVIFIAVSLSVIIFERVMLASGLFTRTQNKA